MLLFTLDLVNSEEHILQMMLLFTFRLDSDTKVPCVGPQREFPGFFDWLSLAPGLEFTLRCLHGSK